MSQRIVNWIVIFMLAAAQGVLACAECMSGDDVTVEHWRSIIGPQQLSSRMSEPKLLIIDVRTPEQYAAGHIPGAINIPAGSWQAPEAVETTAHYEKLLGEAGVLPSHHIVIYGNHGGTADGSAPAMVLARLGHAEVAFLDGVGMDQWKSSGYILSTEPRTLPAATYKARPIDGTMWNLSDVLKNIGNKDVVFYDARSRAEFDGAEPLDNRHGGHIPGAVLCDDAEFLDPRTKTMISAEEVRMKLAERNVTPDKTIVLYSQNAAGVSLAFLALRDLGYAKLAVYDAGWQEYGNRDDTPIEGN